MLRNKMTKLAYLMMLLNISTNELKDVLHVDRTLISKWKTGNRNLPIGQPYFDQIIEYFILKNKTLGTGLLEDFFEDVYPNKRRSKDSLKKNIRSYLLDLPDKTSNNYTSNTTNSLFTSRHTTYIGIEGRQNAIMTIFETAEKMSAPARIAFLDYEDLEWVSIDMLFMLMFFDKIKKMMEMGHSIDIILYVNNKQTPSYEMHKRFLEIMEYDNLNLYILPTKFNKKFNTSMYGIEQQVIVIGSNAINDLSQLTSLLTFDKIFVESQFGLFKNFKEVSSPIYVSDKMDLIEIMVNIHKSSYFIKRDYFHLGRVLCYTSMSEPLLDEILVQNQINEAQKDRCFRSYNAFHEIIKSSDPDSNSGFYYCLEDIVSYLSYETSVNYALSAATGTVIKMSKEQYLRHFADTAAILLNNPHYKVILHNLPTSQAIWVRDNSWAFSVKSDGLTRQSKYHFTDDPRVVENFKVMFQTLYEHAPRQNIDTAAISDLFMKIGRGEILNP